MTPDLANERLGAFGTNPKRGLSVSEAWLRLARGGANEVPPKPRSPLLALARNLSSLLV
ncbi:MAG: hypothetical protein KGO02_14985 [Alphaproteobacteria bacterium]|nr:hypothetical protein [Alphaproteobacteria bacterium]